LQLTGETDVFDYSKVVAGSTWRVLTREVDDIFSRYARLGGYERYELASAFDYWKTDLEDENGNLFWRSTEKKAAIAKEIREAATKSWHIAPSGANGAALLSIYLEAQTLPGEQAARLDLRRWAMYLRSRRTHRGGYQ
jgi:hypothetical protein